MYLSSAELAAIVAILGRLPSVEEYQTYASKIDSMAPEIYQYLNFDQMSDFMQSAQHAQQEVVVKLDL